MSGLSQAIKADLPKFPDDVVEQWLAPFAQSTGWPPAPTPDDVPLNRWRYILGRRPLRHFQQLEWLRLTSSVSLGNLTPDSKSTMLEMVAGTFLGEENAFSRDIPDMPQRIGSVLEYLAKHAALPCRPILELRSDGLHILDGNHRMAALFVASGCFGAAEIRKHACAVEPRQDYWVGALEATLREKAEKHQNELPT